MRIPGRVIRLLLLHIVAMTAAVQAYGHKFNLILAEYGKDSSGEQTQTLVRYHFKDGVLVANESVLTTRTVDLRYDLGGNQIDQNRYVITDWGDVIDLSTRQILFKSAGELVTIDRNSNSVIVRVDRVDDEGVYAFDLTSHKYRRIEHPGLWAMEGTISPNGQFSASGEGGEIWLQRQTGKKYSLGKQFYRSGTFECSSFAKPAFVWLDDKRLLTQRGNGNLVVVDIEGKVEPLLTIPDVEKPACGPELRRDQGNRIYYQGILKAWRIDVDKRTFEPYLWEAVGNAFDIEYDRDALYGHRIRYQGVEIGRWWCDSGAAYTAPGHLAIPFGQVGSNLGYPEGVKVWSEENRSWTTIKPDSLVAIIGWVEE